MQSAKVPWKLLTATNFPREIVAPEHKTNGFTIDPKLTLDTIRQQSVENAEKEYLIKQLQIHQGRISSTAEAAGIGVRQLHKLMCKYYLHKEDFKKAIPPLS